MSRMPSRSAYFIAVKRATEGLSHISTGACPGCNECGIPEDSEDYESDSADTAFSWSSCDTCGSSLGGARHAAHGVSPEHGVIHFDICTDCLFFLEYGEEPEAE
jgi:hypothetical protein